MFGQANMEGLKEELEKEGLLKIKEGTTRVRILPPTADANGTWYRPTITHYGFMIGGEFKKYTCPRSVGRVSCPICEAAQGFYQAGDPKSREIYSRIKAKHEYYYQVYNVDAPTEIKRMRAPKTLYNQIRLVSIGFGNITDPQQGFDLYITATKKGGGGNKSFLEYSVLPHRAPTPIDPRILPLAGTMVNLNTLFTTAAEDAELIAALKYIDTTDRFADANRHQTVAPGQPLPPVQPSGHPICLKNGNYNATDVDCQGCAFNAPCQENRAKIAAAFKASVAPAAAPTTPAMPTMPAPAPVAPAPAAPTLGAPTGTVPSQTLEELQRRLSGK